MWVDRVQTIPGVKVVAMVSDGPVLVRPYSSVGRRMQVEQVVIDYRLDGRNEWCASGSGIVMTGPELKKDGSHSVNTVQERAPRDFADEGRAADWAWLIEMVVELKPAGAPVTAGGGFEIEWTNEEWN